jgi:hypothetical protein
MLYHWDSDNTSKSMFHCPLVSHVCFLLGVVHGAGKYWPLLRLEPEISLAFRSSFHSKLGAVYSPPSRVLEMAVKMCLDHWKGMARDGLENWISRSKIGEHLNMPEQNCPKGANFCNRFLFLSEQQRRWSSDKMKSSCRWMWVGQKQHSGTTSAIFVTFMLTTKDQTALLHQHCDAKLSVPNLRQQRFRTFVKRRPGSLCWRYGHWPFNCMLIYR